MYMMGSFLFKSKGMAGNGHIAWQVLVKFKSGWSYIPSRMPPTTRVASYYKSNTPKYVNPNRELYIQIQDYKSKYRIISPTM